MDLLIREPCPDDAEGIVHILNPIIEAGGLTVLDKTFTVDEEREFIASFLMSGMGKIMDPAGTQQYMAAGYHVHEEFGDNGRIIDGDLLRGGPRERRCAFGGVKG